MEKSIRVDKPVSLFGIKSVKSADNLERRVEKLLDQLSEGVEIDPHAHEKLLKIGENISKKSKFKKGPVDDFLDERNSVR